MSRRLDLEPLGFPNCPACPHRLTGRPSICAACAARTLRPLAPRHCSVCSQSWNEGQTTCRNAICDADVSQVADSIVRVVDTPHGSRPFRVHVDPVGDGSEEVSAVADSARERFLTRLGLEDVLHPH
ncbi:hypothetical protein [Streptomyces sp. TS71-3]|uniref:hypothetical protein n=1 Tax=Streptomyces sp. TS71-3 TaxID=2733862 RepID=UPI001B05593E|nr:hypothetical protein [Streptomyces sp. TS71-3]GHJ34760.1 hypothetical protein Sm713_03690 [Streptomyces sp. TS71-3]